MSDENPADVIEQAARVMHHHRCCPAESYSKHHLSTWINTARALHAAGLLADPADRADEQIKDVCNEAVKVIVRVEVEHQGSSPCADKVAYALRDAGLLRTSVDEDNAAEVERLHSWAGLMELLDEHWPEDVFLTLPDRKSRDSGPRIVSLIRWVDQLRTTIDRVRAIHEPIDAVMNPGPRERIVKVCTGCGTDDGNWQRWPCPTVRALDGAGEQHE